MVRISLLDHKFRGEDQKKKSSAPSLRLSLGIHSCFSSWNGTLRTLGGHKQYFGGAQAPKCTPVAPGLFFLSGHISSIRKWYKQ